MKYEFASIDEHNINDFTFTWLEVLQSMRGTKDLNTANQEIRTFKQTFLNHITSQVKYDFYYYLRALKVDGRAVGFTAGIISFFESGVMLQIGTFGITRYARKKGYGRYFINKIIEEMKKNKVNYVWLIPQNEGFWNKQGFKVDTSGLIKRCYQMPYDDDTHYIKPY